MWDGRGRNEGQERYPGLPGGKRVYHHEAEGFTVSSSAWLPIRNMPDWMGDLSLSGHEPAAHSSIVSGNQDGRSIGISISAARVRGGYRVHVRRARSSYPLPL